VCRFLHARTWANAPVEVTRIFHQRVKAFMDKMLKTGSDKGGLLGRITNYVVRYEVRWHALACSLGLPRQPLAPTAGNQSSTMSSCCGASFALQQPSA
jgi:hypothetical protein